MKSRAEAIATTPAQHVTPLDPDSERGKQVAAELGQIFADIDDRLARETAAMTADRKKTPA